MFKIICCTSYALSELFSTMISTSLLFLFSDVVLQSRDAMECEITKVIPSVCLFVCGISLTSGQLFNELFPDCTRSGFLQVVLRRRDGDRIYEMRCLFVPVVPNACFVVLPHWDNITLYWHRANQLCFGVPTSSWVPCKQGQLPFLTSLVWLDPAATGNRTHKSSWSMLVPPYRGLLRSAGGYWGPIRYQGAPSGAPTPDPHGVK